MHRSETEREDDLEFLKEPTDIDVVRWLHNALDEALGEGSRISNEIMVSWLKNQDPPMRRCGHIAKVRTDSTIEEALSALQFGANPDAPWSEVWSQYDQSLMSTGQWIEYYVDDL